LLRDVGVTFKSVEVARGLRRGDTTQGWIHLRFGAVGVPTGLQALVRRATLTWRGEGELNARQVSGWGGGYYSWRAAALAVARASGEGRPSERMEDADLSFSGMVVGDELSRLRARPVEAVADLQIELRRPEVCFDLPVARPVWSSGHGRGARVLGTEPVRAEMRTLLLETGPFSLLDQFEQAVRGPLSPGSEVYYVIRNARGEVTTNSQGAPIGGVLLGGVLIRTRKLDVSDPARKFGSVERSPADWLESVSLTAVRFSVVAAGSREVKIPRLELK
jgi:hypothetical protein